MDALVFDRLMERAHEIGDALLPDARTRLTPSRMLVLALMAMGSDRASIRRAARTMRDRSAYAAEIRRVHERRRLLQILRDLHALGLLRRHVPANGPHRFSLTPRTRRRMQSYVQRAGGRLRSGSEPAMGDAISIGSRPGAGHRKTSQ